MKKSKVLILLQVLVMAAMLLSACQPAAPAATSAPAAPAAPAATTAPAAPAAPAATTAPAVAGACTIKPGLKFGYTLHVPVPFTEEIKFGALQAAKDLGVTVDVVAPDKSDPPQQIALFEGFIAKGVDGLVTVPQGDVWKKTIDDTVAKGIPVITTNVTSPGSAAQAFVGEDGVLNGTSLGTATAAALKEKGITTGKAIVGSCAPSVSILQDRYNGFKAAMAKDAPGVTVSDVMDATSDAGTNYTFWENTATANPDMTLAVGLCSIDIPNLVKIKAKTGATFDVVGFDLEAESMAAIKAGTALVTIGQHPYLQGYLPILMLAQQLSGCGAPVTGWLATPTEVVTAHNVDELNKRQADDAFRVQWYAKFMKDNLSDLSKAVKPFNWAAAAAPTAAPAAACTIKPGLKFGYTLHVPVPFTEEIKFGALQAAKDFGVTVDVVAPDKSDPPQQIALFEGFIAKGVDGLVTVPQGDVWKKTIDDTVAKGIPVITTNVTSPGSKAQAFVGEDGVLNGTSLGTATAAALKEKGITTGKAIVGSCAPSVSILQDRYNGFKAAMTKDAPGITISDVMDATSDAGTNYTFWENTATANPDMTLAVGLCSIDIPNLVKIKAKTGAKFDVVGFDLEAESMAAIKAGTALVTIGQHPYLQGYLPIRMLAQQLSGCGAPVTGWLATPTEVVTAHNVDELNKRQADDAFRVQWYAKFMNDNLSDLSKVVKPFTW